MLRNYFLLLAVEFLVSGYNAKSNIAVEEQKVIKINKDLPFIEAEDIKQGTNADSEGRELGLNNYYLMDNGKPILPVMGEFHCTRYPKDEWEKALLKMKASGINIIATYCFWIHHEEEGNIRFDGNRDVRYFIKLCAKHGLWVFARIGPWCHGECRNGGFPDWFVKKHKGAQHRGYNGELDPAVKRWYRALAKQFEGLYFKEGGPIIGIQVDNEVYSAPGKWGYKYLCALEEYALQVGIDVPIYTATGWSGPQLPEDLLGTYGAYPAAPWAQNSEKLAPQIGYLFSPNRKDKAIGSDWEFGDIKNTETPIYRYPFLTVEMGGGNQMTYHRRPRLAGKDMIALVYTRLGVGANMIGYYVYHGTQHPLSWHNEYPTQESKNSIYPYPNDYPMISYDFQAPINEWGFIRDYYHDFKLTNYFINDFGSDLAPMYPTIPEDNPTDPADNVNLRYSVRSRGGSGYIFFSNYVRHLNMKAHNGAQFKLQLENEELTVPDEGGIDIKNGVYGVLPFNYDMQGVVLKYATAHPFSILDNDTKTYCFYAIEGIEPEFKFEKSNIDKIKVRNGKKITADGFVKVTKMKPGKDCRIEITTTSGENFTILLLTEEEARFSYKFKIKGIETLLITNNMAFYDEKAKEVEIRSPGKNEFDFYTYPQINMFSTAITQTGRTGSFFKYQVTLPSCKMPDLNFREISEHKAFETYCESLNGKTPKGPTYSHLFDNKAPYLVYELELPKSLPQGVNDVLLEFDYQGNTAQVYADGVIIADDYYSEVKMPFALRRYRDKLAKSKFLFQVTPLMPKYEIYFEKGTKLGFANTKHAVLNGISVVPEYAVKVKLP